MHGGGGRPGRHLAGHRRRRRDGADLGPRHRPDPPHPHRPHRRGAGGGGRPGRHLAGHRQRRRDGADLGPATGQTRHTLTGHTGWVPALAVAPDGTWLATASDDGTVRIWDPATGQTRHTLTGHTDGVRAVAVAPDGTWLATAGDDGTVRIWDPPTGSPPHPHRPHRRGAGGGGRPRTAAWLATAGDDRTVRIWDPPTGTDTPHPHRPHQRGAGGGGRPGRHLAGHRQRRRDGADLGPAPPGTPATPSPATPAGGGGGGRPGRHLAGHRQRRRDGADLGPGHRPAAPHPHRPHQRGARRWRSPRTAPGWPPPATTRTVRIWDPATGSRRHTLTGHTGGVRRGGGRPGRHLAGHRRRRRDGADLGPGHRHRHATPSPATPARCRRWRSPRTAPGSPPPATTGRCGSGTRPPASTATPSPATPAGCTRWRSPRTAPGSPPPATTGRCGSGTRPPAQHRHTLTGHTDWVAAVAVAPDGTWLASASNDQTVRIWDPATGEELCSLRVDGPLVTATTVPGVDGPCGGRSPGPLPVVPARDYRHGRGIAAGRRTSAGERFGVARSLSLRVLWWWGGAVVGFQ